MSRIMLRLSLSACAALALQPAAGADAPRASAAPSAASPAAARRPACDPGDGGLRLPAGFCALVVADDLGRGRHLAVRDNGDMYLAIRGKDGGVVALRDTDGDGRADLSERFGPDGGTGIALRGGYLYFAPNDRVLRFPLAPDELVPSASPQLVVGGFPEQQSHAVKPFDFDGSGNLYVNVGAPSNACQDKQRSPGSPGLDPCPQLERHGGVWRFRADETEQRFDEDGERFASGIRNAVALDWNHVADALFVAQHGRDQLSELWPDLYTDEQRAELPAEELLRLEEGGAYGWPYCYYDHLQGRKVLAPEYGGDGKRAGRCADAPTPVAAFPGHWGPNDLLFYGGKQFPERYRDGAFVAFHGSWNRQPFEQKGYLVAFVPFRDGDVAGDYEIFADGFTGRERITSPRQAEHRPTGLAEGPDGSLYVSDSVNGRIWRIVYTGEG